MFTSFTTILRTTPGRLAIVALVFAIFALIASAEEPTAPPAEVDATSGWNGAIAFNPKNNTWFIVSQGVVGVSDKVSISGRIVDNDHNPITNEFRIDQAELFTGGPKVAYAPDTDKFLVVWVQETNARGSSGDVYGRFYDTSGKPLGDSFNVTPNDPYVPNFHPNSVMHYDSKNKRFVFAFENRAGSIVAVYMKSVGVGGTVGPTVKVAEEPGNFLGAPSLAVNEKDNEYCVSYQNSAAGHWEAGGDNSSSLAIRRIDASNLSVGPQTIGSHDLFFNNSIVYNSLDDKYLVTWSNYQGDKTLAKTLDDCSADLSTEPDALTDVTHGSIATYNPKSNTYGIIGMDCCSFRNHYLIVDTNLNLLDQGAVFLDSRSGRGGNYIPVIMPNTNNGTYGITSSVDYATTRFISNIGSTVLIGKRYGGGGPAFSAPPRPTLPTQGLPTDLGQLIQQIFTWSLGLLGIAVFVMFFYAGFLWLTAAGNSANVGEAKSRMTNAVFGAILLLSSYLILNTINPNFVKNTFDLKGLGPQSTLDPALETEPEPPPGNNPPPNNPPPTEPEPASLESQLQAEIDKYTLPTTKEQQGQILNTVAWNNRSAGWVLLGKASGNSCRAPNGALISCDYLVHQPTMYGYDVFISEGSIDMKASWQGPDTGIAQMVANGSRSVVQPVQP